MGLEVPIVAVVATYLPATFQWAPPTVETRLTEEPDVHEIQARLLYDHTMGRLGSDIRIRLKGSDDDTRSSCRARTHVAIRLAQPVPVGALGVHLVARFRCEEAGPPEFDHYDEGGTSSVQVDYRSRPFARLDLDSLAGTYVYDEPFLEGIASFAPDTGIIVGGMDAQYVKITADPPVFAVGLDEVRPQRGMLVSVGIEDEVVVDSDDTTYIVRLRSHWFLESVELTTY